MTKEYIGDGAFVDFDGYSLILTAENGIRATDRIVLEPFVMKALLRYVKGLGDAAREAFGVDNHEREQP